jgi:hypothetical protein
MREGSIFHSNLLNHNDLKDGEGVKPAGIYFHAHEGVSK